MTADTCSIKDLDACLKAARSGDQPSLNCLILHYEPEVRKIAYKYFLNRAEYDDLLQEGRIAIYKAIFDYDPSAKVPFLHFVRMVIKRKLIDSVRAHNRQKHLNLNNAYSLNKRISEDQDESFLNLVPYEEDPETKVVALDEARYYLRELSKLFSELELNVFHCHYLLGMKQKEITEYLGLSSKSLDNAIQRIRRKILNYRKNELVG